MLEPKNVLGTALVACGTAPLTGFYRDGCCNTGPEDVGQHTVCVQVNAVFLEFSRAHGNDLSTPRPEHGFPGLKPGDRWCVCVSRWREAFSAGFAAPIVLAATHAAALDAVALEDLKRYAVDAEAAERP